MSEPWEDFGGTAVAEDSGPWKEFEQPEELTSHTPAENYPPRPDAAWMRAGGMGPTPPVGTPLMGNVPIASMSQYGQEEAAQRSAITVPEFLQDLIVPPIDPNEVPSGEQIKRQYPLVPMPAAIASSALAKGVAGIGQFLTSPKGIQQAVTAATPILGTVQRLKWVYDMAKSGGEAAGDLTARIEKAIQNPSAITTEDWQGMADDAVNTAITLAGAGKLSSAEAARITGIRAPLGRITESQQTRFSKDLAAQLEAEAKQAKIPTKYPTAERRVGVGPIPVGELQQEPGIPQLANAALAEAMQLVKVPGREAEALNALRAAVQGRVEVAGRRTVEEPVPASPLIGAERSVGVLRSAEDLLAERRQPALEPAVEQPTAPSAAPTTAPKAEPIDLTAELDFLAPRGPLEASKRAEVMKKLQERKQALEDAARAEQSLRQLVNAPEPVPPNPAQIPPPSIDLRQLEATMRRNAIPEISQKTGVKPEEVQKGVDIENQDHPWLKRIPGAAEQVTLDELTADKNAYKGEKAPPKPEEVSIPETIVRKLEQAADEARKRLEQNRRSIKFNEGPLSELPNIRDFAIIGAAKLGRFALDKAQWVKEMLSEFGEQIRPYIDTIYDASRALVEDQKTGSQTAITRNSAAVPTRQLVTTWTRKANAPLPFNPIGSDKEILHFGSGKDAQSTKLLGSLGAKVTEYDPTFSPDVSVLKKKYDTLVSNYVLNVLPPESRGSVIEQIASLLKPNGLAYISVRGKGDIVRGTPEADGVRTSKGTFQKTFTPKEISQELEKQFWIVKTIRGGDKSPTVTIEAQRPKHSWSDAFSPAPTKGIITGRALEKWADDQLRGGATHAGPDVFAAYLVKGAALIERGVINFAEWSAKMIAEHGDAIKPHLAVIYDAAKATIARAPIEASGSLKSAREIVEQRLAAPTAERPKLSTPTVPAKKPSGVTLDDVYKHFEPEPKEKVPVSRQVLKQASNLVEGVATGFSTKYRPTNAFSEAVAKEYGRKPVNIAAAMERLKGSSGKGQAEIYRFNRDVASLVKGDERDFNAYMFLNRSLDRLRQDAADIEKALAGGEVKQLNRRAVAQYTIPELESKLSLLEQQLGPEKLARFQKAAEGYQQYMDTALRLQVESGRMSTEVYNAIKNGNQFYAPFKVMKYLEENSKPEGTGAKIDTVADYTKAMKGIEDPNFKLGDMLAAARTSIIVSRILADKAQAMHLFADAAKVDTKGLFIKQLAPDEPAPGNWQKINVFENGRKVQYAVPPEVATAVQLSGPASGGWMRTFFRALATPVRLGAITLNLPFQVSNLSADVPRQAGMSQYGITLPFDLVAYPFDLLTKGSKATNENLRKSAINSAYWPATYLKSLFDSIGGDVFGKDSKAFLDFLDSGVGGGTVAEFFSPKSFEYRDPTTMSNVGRLVRKAMTIVPEISAAVEQTSKVTGVQQAMRYHGAKSGSELAKLSPEAITELRRFSGSPDFSRIGKIVEDLGLNYLYMFLNARIQGAIADAGRMLGRDGPREAARTWFNHGLFIGLPTAYLYFINHSPEMEDDYNKIPQKTRDNYWPFPKGSFIINENGEVIRDYWLFPKRESSKWTANLTESALNFARQKDPQAFWKFGQQMLEELSPVNIQGNTAQERLESTISGMNPGIKVPIEITTGRDLYRHRDLIPENTYTGKMMKQGSPENQFNARTAEAFKKLAILMPDVAPEFLRSPIMLENITRNLTAGFFNQFLSRKPVKGRSDAENLALFQRFQALPYTEDKKFTKRIEELQRMSADEYLTMHRIAIDALDKNEGKPIWQILQGIPKEPKLMQHVVDMWVSKNNGVTFKDRQILELPPKARAQYIMETLAPMTAEQKQQAFLDMGKKRILTEQVMIEMSKLAPPAQPKQ